MPAGTSDDVVSRYLELGLRLGRHVEGLVDAYYGPRALADRVARERRRPPAELAAEAGRLVADLDAGQGEGAVGAGRRRWIRTQVLGLHTTARKLAGEPVAYLDEVERCYGVRPAVVPEDTFAAAHARLDAALPGTGPLRERSIAWREAHAVPPDKLEPAIRSLAEDLRERTRRQFGLPDGEQVEWVFETGRPWSGFNYYQGGLRSRVAINVDLPVLSLSLGHLVAHEAYPGHHTEHTRKEVGLVRRRGWGEEAIFLVGTPQCTLAEGLADLGVEVALGRRPEPVVAEHLAPLGVRFDAEVAAAVAEAGEALSWVRSNAAIRLHHGGAPAGDAVSYLERWALLPHARAEKAVSFLTDPTWRAYSHCYTEGLRLCRADVGGEPARFERLVTEQLLPADLVGQGAP
ncbi:MAG TPA: hypothetical protein VFW63_02955 [Acidimicrobiales bacterium]|nr:hypothetical protein [Acidimicrobiales bacterium]